ncbi:hypothetical protein LEM8419_01030 [Neolewinella maritima]|uniref:Uncharacterized protein n=1 Tax=Neolewinella maritima TaxID=1383882 RepID=A0ABM9AYD5_9BACT|nr:hypothetical protein LEM8419_01030 [Neolewinella maritima]
MKAKIIEYAQGDQSGVPRKGGMDTTVEKYDLW